MLPGLRWVSNRNGFPARVSERTEDAELTRPIPDVESLFSALVVDNDRELLRVRKVRHLKIDLVLTVLLSDREYATAKPALAS